MKHPVAAQSPYGHMVIVLLLLIHMDCLLSFDSLHWGIVNLIVNIEIVSQDHHIQ